MQWKTFQALEKDVTYCRATQTPSCSRATWTSVQREGDISFQKEGSVVDILREQGSSGRIILFGDLTAVWFYENLDWIL